MTRNKQIFGCISNCVFIPRDWKRASGASRTGRRCLLEQSLPSLADSLRGARLDRACGRARRILAAHWAALWRDKRRSRSPVYNRRPADSAPRRLLPIGLFAEVEGRTSGPFLSRRWQVECASPNRTPPLETKIESEVGASLALGPGACLLAPSAAHWKEW